STVCSTRAPRASRCPSSHGRVMHWRRSAWWCPPARPGSRPSCLSSWPLPAASRAEWASVPRTDQVVFSLNEKSTCAVGEAHDTRCDANRIRAAKDEHMNATRTVVTTEVGIVGGGPAGLMLSPLLAQAGIDNIVVEKRDHEAIR